MSAELRGLPAAPGVATGAPWIYRPPAVDTQPRRSITDAAEQAVVELESLAGTLRDEGRPNEAEILDAQALMATDEELLGVARDLEAGGATPVAAMLEAGDRAAATLEALGDAVLSARAADVRDVAGRVARHLAGARPPRLERRSIVVADDLAPSVTVELDRALLAGIALEGGSRTSHAAILARALGIPAVVCLPGIVERSAGIRELGIDGTTGLAVLDPDEAARSALARAAAATEERRAADEAFAGRPLTTADGHRILCAANIGHPDEAAGAFTAGAEGIGLFRTEFAFAGRSGAPDEEEQREAYARVLRAAGEAPVVIRLVDIGGDKPLPYVPIPAEPNPFLGVRGMRLADLHPDLFATQLRAILRACIEAGRAVSIMAPMVADGGDVRIVRALVERARTEVPDAPEPRVGVMIEVPSAVLLAEQLAGTVDFMSIGTNDLTQYLLAADRSNAQLAERQDPLHPAVLRAVARVTEAAHATAGRCHVAVCGEMAGDPAGASLLVGLDVEELSMDPGAFNAVKRAVAERSRVELTQLATAAQQLRSAAEVRELVAAS